MEDARAAGHISYAEMIVDTDVAKVSVVGIGMRSHAGVVRTRTTSSAGGSTAGAADALAGRAGALRGGPASGAAWSGSSALGVSAGEATEGRMGLLDGGVGLLGRVLRAGSASAASAASSAGLFLVFFTGAGAGVGSAAGRARFAPSVATGRMVFADGATLPPLTSGLESSAPLAARAGAASGARCSPTLLPLAATGFAGSLEAA